MTSHLERIRLLVGHQLLGAPSVSVAIRDPLGRVLLVRHSEGGVWVLPGGAIEPEESPAEAAVREAREETALAIAPQRLVGVYGGRSSRSAIARRRHVLRDDRVRRARAGYSGAAPSPYG